MLFPEEIVDLEEVAAHPNILVFGKSGVGKTTLAGSDDAILFLNCEAEGTLSAKRSKTLGKNVKQWNIRTWQDWEKATDWIKDAVAKCQKEKKPFPFKWIVVDTLTTLQYRILMRHLMDEALKRKPDRDPNVPDKQEYLKNQLMLQRSVKELMIYRFACCIWLMSWSRQHRTAKRFCSLPSKVANTWWHKRFWQ